MQQQQISIPLDKTTPIVCEACQNDTFTQVLYLRKVSKFITGDTKDGLYPVPSFACNKCGHINEEFQAKSVEE